MNEANRPLPPGMPTGTPNPYAAPASMQLQPSAAISQQPLAGRLERLGAVMVDSLVGGLVVVLGFVLGMVSGERNLGIAIGVVFGLGFLIYQAVLLADNGWTLGKKLQGIRIVRNDGSDASLGRILGLRMLLTGLVGAIPYVGTLFSLVDSLFIFSAEQRCLHDLIADTKVVKASGDAQGA